ncbi:18343_t:CDS:2, partial [Gigaspora margarita]
AQKLRHEFYKKRHDEHNFEVLENTTDKRDRELNYLSMHNIDSVNIYENISFKSMRCYANRCYPIPPIIS